MSEVLYLPHLKAYFRLPLKKESQRLPQTLQKRAAELEVRVQERAESVKSALREYREVLRKSAQPVKASSRSRSTLAQKQLDLERANAEYMELRKELDAILSRLQNARRRPRHTLVDLD